MYISVEDSDFQVKEVTCLSLFCQLYILENIPEFLGWGEEARFALFNKVCFREGMPNW